MNEVEQIHNLSKQLQINFTDHALKRSDERSIDIYADILPALQNCKIVEEYPNDYPYKSFLVYGRTSSDKPLHIVCAIVVNKVWIITEYFPDNNKWENDYMTRKEEL